MTEYKYSVKNTTKIERERLKRSALGYAALGGSKPSKDVMKRVDTYVDGKFELSEILADVLGKYQDKRKDT